MSNLSCLRLEQRSILHSPPKQPRFVAVMASTSYLLAVDFALMQSGNMHLLRAKQLQLPGHEINAAYLLWVDLML